MARQTAAVHAPESAGIALITINVFTGFHPSFLDPGGNQHISIMNTRPEIFRQPMRVWASVYFRRTQMYRTSNTLSENIRMKAVELLNRHLAAAIDLHAQVKQAHWNVRGPAFIALHELFDKVADLVEGYSDTIAERAATLGGTAQGTIHVAVERSFLKPYELGVASAGLAGWRNAARHVGPDLATPSGFGWRIAK